MFVIIVIFILFDNDALNCESRVLHVSSHLFTLVSMSFISFTFGGFVASPRSRTPRAMVFGLYFRYTFCQARIPSMSSTFLPYSPQSLAGAELTKDIVQLARPLLHLWRQLGQLVQVVRALLNLNLFLFWEHKNWNRYFYSRTTRIL